MLKRHLMIAYGMTLEEQRAQVIDPRGPVFVPSAGRISHNPREHTDDAELVAAVNALLDVVAELLAGEG
jgi:acetylornithine deacetylase/succinyl-diaminopimelate desuccinylase-like protein